jgi:gliding motility-associated-like protein
MKIIPFIKTVFVLTGLVIIISTRTFSQNNLCNGADPFCTGTTYNFPAGVNAGTAQSGPNYGCLGSQPNPAWYYLQILNPGNINIQITSSPSVDIDFACWGPFSNQLTPCTALLTASCSPCYSDYPQGSYAYPYGNLVDCSYAGSNVTETCYIPNGVPGQFYILLLTNFSNTVTNIIFSQTNGSGSTNCGILAPPVIGDTVCVGETINLSVNTPTPGATYSWTGPNGWSSNQMNPTIPNAQTNMSGTYSLVITVGAQVSPAVTCTVLVNPNPIITITPANPTTCSGVAVNLTGNSTGPGTTYFWDNSSTTNPTPVNPTTPTIYSVTGTDANGCTGTASVLVNINPDLVVSVTPSSPFICIGGNIDITASGGDSYVWSPPSALSCANCATTTADPITTTTYTVSAIDAAGCTGSTTVTVTASPGPNIQIFPPDPIVCRSDTSHLVVNGASNCTWAPAYGLDVTSGNVVIASPFTTTTYTVTGYNNGCLGTGEVTVTVMPTPLVDFSADVTEGCETLWVNFSDNTTPAVHDWNWNFGDNTIINSINHFQNPKHLFEQPGTYDITLTVVSDDGCSAIMTIPQMITIHKDPIADFIYNPMVTDVLDQNIWFSDQSTNANYWYWDFGEDYTLGNTSNEPDPTHEYNGEGTYWVTLAVESIYGCVDTIRMPVVIEPLITFYVPNSFTPNQNGLNDYYITYGVGIDESSFEIRIFDRWGKLMFFSPDLYSGWDGREQGSDKICPEGTYACFVSFLDVKGNLHKYKQNINLIR